MEATGTGTLQLLNGHFDQTGGGTILANGSGAAVVINSSGITGGVLSTLNGGLLTTAGGTVDSLTNGTITSGSTVTVANNSDLYLGGSIANHGTIAVNSSGNTTELRVGGGQTVTLGGGGVVSAVQQREQSDPGCRRRDRQADQRRQPDPGCRQHRQWSDGAGQPGGGRHQREPVHCPVPTAEWRWVQQRGSDGSPRPPAASC